jgi:hypothetical protein
VATARRSVVHHPQGRCLLATHHQPVPAALRPLGVGERFLVVRMTRARWRLSRRELREPEGATPRPPNTHAAENLSRYSTTCPSIVSAGANAQVAVAAQRAKSEDLDTLVRIQVRHAPDRPQVGPLGSPTSEGFGQSFCRKTNNPLVTERWGSARPASSPPPRWRTPRPNWWTPPVVTVVERVRVRSL